MLLVWQQKTVSTKGLTPFGCSRICSCQSTKEPQGSTGVGRYALSISIRSAYFNSIPTGFNKRPDLLWDQRC
jgi:hypothetical protein